MRARLGTSERASGSPSRMSQTANICFTMLDRVKTIYCSCTIMPEKMARWNDIWLKRHKDDLLAMPAGSLQFVTLRFNACK